MECHEGPSFVPCGDQDSLNISTGQVEEFENDRSLNLQDGRHNTFSPNSDSNEQIHMAEFQRAIDRLRLRRLSSTSSQSFQGQEDSRKGSIVRDLLQGQKTRASTTISSTCTSPLSSKGTSINKTRIIINKWHNLII